MKRMFTAALTAAALTASAGAQAWDSRTQFYSPGGAYLGEARTRNNPRIDASIPLQIRPMDPNGFSNAFARGLEMRRMQEQDEAYSGQEMRHNMQGQGEAYSTGEDLDSKLRRLHEAQDELRRVQEGAALAKAIKEAQILGIRPAKAGGEVFWTSGRCGREKDGWVLFVSDDGGEVRDRGCGHAIGGDRIAVERQSGGEVIVIEDSWRLTAAGQRMTVRRPPTAIPSAKASSGPSLADRILGEQPAARPAISRRTP